MKKRAIQEFKRKSVIEMEKFLHESREKLWELKRDLAQGKVKNVKEIKKIRKEIARTITFIGMAEAKK